MCSYLTVPTDIAGSAKGAQGWFSVTSAQVYFDHPFHAPFDHTLNIDFADPARGPGARVAVELSADSARRLVASITEALAAAGPVGNVKRRRLQRPASTCPGRTCPPRSRGGQLPSVEGSPPRCGTSTEDSHRVQRHGSSARAARCS